MNYKSRLKNYFFKYQIKIRKITLSAKYSKFLDEMLSRQKIYINIYSNFYELKS